MIDRKWDKKLNSYIWMNSRIITVRFKIVREHATTLIGIDVSKEVRMMMVKQKKQRRMSCKKK